LKIPEVCFKTDLVYQRSEGLHQKLKEILVEMWRWTVDKKVPLFITEAVTTIEEDQKLGRVSATHREGRAVDLSSRAWPAEIIGEFQLHFNNKYKDVAAVTTAGEPLLVVFHNSGHGDHFHVQIRRLT